MYATTSGRHTGRGLPIRSTPKGWSDINIKNDDGDTVLDIARYGENSEVIKLLEAAARKQR